MALSDPIDPKILACAIARTTILFHDYRDQIGKLPGPDLKPDFFEKFVRTWRLARTIGKNKREAIRDRLVNGDLERLRKRNAATVDEIAGEYRDAKLSARTSAKNETYRTPRSLLSKIGFLVRPGLYVPYDTYARDGLNLRLGTKRNGGCGHLEDSYKAYLQSFDKCYALLKDDVANACDKVWVNGLADELSLDEQWRGSEAFYRKVLDDVLMSEAGRVQ